MPLPFGSSHGPPTPSPAPQCVVPYAVGRPLTVSMMSSSPHSGHSVPWWMASPSSQKAGHRPCLWDWGFAPKRMAASKRVCLPAAGVKVALDSIRDEVHCPEGDWTGMSWTVEPPVSWRF